VDEAMVEGAVVRHHRVLGQHQPGRRTPREMPWRGT